MNFQQLFRKECVQFHCFKYFTSSDIDTILTIIPIDSIQWDLLLQYHHSDHFLRLKEFSMYHSLKDVFGYLQDRQHRHVCLNYHASVKGSYNNTESIEWISYHHLTETYTGRNYDNQFCIKVNEKVVVLEYLQGNYVLLNLPAMFIVYFLEIEELWGFKLNFHVNDSPQWNPFQFIQKNNPCCLGQWMEMLDAQLVLVAAVNESNEYEFWKINLTDEPNYIATWNRVQIKANPDIAPYGTSHTIAYRKLFFIGGSYREHSDELEYANSALHVLDLTTWEWMPSISPSLWIPPRQHGTLFCAKPYLLYCGGLNMLDRTRNLNQVFLLDTVLMQWIKPYVTGSLPKSYHEENDGVEYIQLSSGQYLSTILNHNRLNIHLFSLTLGW